MLTTSIITSKKIPSSTYVLQVKELQTDRQRYGWIVGCMYDHLYLNFHFKKTCLFTYVLQKKDIQIDRQEDRQTGKETEIDRQGDRQTGKETNKQIDRDTMDS